MSRLMQQRSSVVARRGANAAYYNAYSALYSKNSLAALRRGNFGFSNFFKLTVVPTTPSVQQPYIHTSIKRYFFTYIQFTIYSFQFQNIIAVGRWRCHIGSLVKVSRKISVFLACITQPLSVGVRYSKENAGCRDKHLQTNNFTDSFELTHS